MVIDKHELCNYIVVIRDIHFEWDPRKNISNTSKHGVSFEEASTVFSDKHYLDITDPDHSQDEERFIALGISASCRMLVVCYSVRKEETIIRIISARKATTSETEQYGEMTNARRI